ARVGWLGMCLCGDCLGGAKTVPPGGCRFCTRPACRFCTRADLRVSRILAGRSACRFCTRPACRFCTRVESVDLVTRDPREAGSPQLLGLFWEEVPAVVVEPDGLTIQMRSFGVVHQRQRLAFLAVPAGAANDDDELVLG